MSICDRINLRRALTVFVLSVGAMASIPWFVVQSLAVEDVTNPSVPPVGSAYVHRHETAFRTPTSVMTYEVGAITGDLRLATEVDREHNAVVRIQYDQAIDWYTVEGGYFRVEDIYCEEQFHVAAVEWLRNGYNDLYRLHVDCATPLTNTARLRDS